MQIISANQPEIYSLSPLSAADRQLLIAADRSARARMALKGSHGSTREPQHIRDILPLAMRRIAQRSQTAARRRQ